MSFVKSLIELFDTKKEAIEFYSIEENYQLLKMEISEKLSS